MNADEYVGPMNVLEQYLIPSVKRGRPSMNGRGIRVMGSLD